MPAEPPIGRAFERMLPAPLQRETERSAPGLELNYERLLQVSMANTYYAPPYDCPDFEGSPTSQCAELMRQLGLLLRRDPAGFSVLHDGNRRDDLVAYLRRQKALTGGFEARLSFMLAVKQPHFANFTSLPDDFNPSAANFYFCNRDAHLAGGNAVLTRGQYARAGDLRQLVPSQFPMPVSDDVEKVEVRDIFGRVVSSLPRCVPGGDGPPQCRNTLYLDLCALRENAYVVRELRSAAPPRDRNILYTMPAQFCFIDLLFTAPSGRTTTKGIYPIDGIAGPQPSFSPVRYSVTFENRSTYWRYWVVLPERSRGVSGLRIETEPPDAVMFSGPTATEIATATPAFLFVSSSPVALSQTPAVRFTLTSDDGIVLRSMPIASRERIRPEPAQKGVRYYSDIYVHV